MLRGRTLGSDASAEASDRRNAIPAIHGEQQAGKTTDKGGRRPPDRLAYVPKASYLPPAAPGPPALPMPAEAAQLAVMAVSLPPLTAPESV